MHPSATIGTSATGFSSNFLVSNSGSLISIKLKTHDYLLWRSQFLPVFSAQGLIGYVDRSLTCPSEFHLDKTGNKSKDLNPQYSAWIQQDQNVFVLG